MPHWVCKLSDQSGIQRMLHRCMCTTHAFVQFKYRHLKFVLLNHLRNRQFPHFLCSVLASSQQHHMAAGSRVLLAEKQHYPDPNKHTQIHRHHTPIHTRYHPFPSCPLLAAVSRPAWRTKGTSVRPVPLARAYIYIQLTPECAPFTTDLLRVSWFAEARHLDTPGAKGRVYV